MTKKNHNSNNNIISTSTSTTITARLRSALRLVHCLQKERGASSSYYALQVSKLHKQNDKQESSIERKETVLTGIGASLACYDNQNNNDNNNNDDDSTSSVIRTEKKKNGDNDDNRGLEFVDFLESTMMNTREGTDAAFIVFLSSSMSSSNSLSSLNLGRGNNNHKKPKPWEESLKRVRACVDNVHLSTTTTTGTATGNVNTTKLITNSTSNNNNIPLHFVGSHRVVVMFNILIGTIIDEAVIQIVKNQQNLLKKSDAAIVHRPLSPTHNDQQQPQSQLLIGPGSGGRNEVSFAKKHHKSSSLVNLNPPHTIESLEQHQYHPINQETSPPEPTGTKSGTKITKVMMMNNIHMLSRSLPLHYDEGTITTIHNVASGNKLISSEGRITTVSPPQTLVGKASVGGSVDKDDNNNTNSIDSTHRHSNNNDIPIIQGNTTWKHEQLIIPPANQNSNNNIQHVNKDSTNVIATSLSSVADYEYKMPIRDSGNSLNTSLLISGEGDKQKISLKNLMSLLLSFVKLKESIGLERAILCNLMISEVDKHHPSSSKLFAGLVVEDANQTMIIRELQMHSKKVLANRSKVGNNMASLLVLMEDMLRPSKEIEQLQDMIRRNFNLDAFRQAMSFKKFWEVLSMYIDKLHSMELLLVEELQSVWLQLAVKQSAMTGSFEHSKRSMSYNSLGSFIASFNNKDEENYEKQYLYNILIPREDSEFHYEISDDEAVQEISKLPSEQIKRLLISHLAEDLSNMNTTKSINNENVESNDDLGNPLNVPHLQKIPQHILKEWEIDLYEIEFRKRIGRGVGGTTYLAEWSGQDVAVKVAAITDLGLEGWQAEVNSLQRLHHPNVIRLLGSIYNPSPQTYGLVLEYCESGDLSTALTQPTPSNFFWRVAEDVAKGMNYLHHKNILHRDIKPANVLLSGNVPGGNFTAKLSDFGVAIMHHGGVGGEEHTAETGTYRWMPPEIIRHESYSFAADVYSYALVLWQLVTHEIPFKNLSQIEAAGKVAVERARPPLPHGTPELIIALIETCWRENPDERLSFHQILVELKEIYKVLSERDKYWLSLQYGHPVYDVRKGKNKEEEEVDGDFGGNHRRALRRGSDNTFDSSAFQYSGNNNRCRNKRGDEGRKKKCNDFDRSKSPNRSNKGGGLFAIFHPNRNR